MKKAKIKKYNGFWVVSGKKGACKCFSKSAARLWYNVLNK